MREPGRVLQALGGREHLGPGLPQAAHQVRVRRGRPGIAGRAAAAGRHAGHRDDVLDADRAPGQRPGPGPVRRADRRADRVERPAEPFQPFVRRQQVEVRRRARAAALLDGPHELAGPGEQDAASPTGKGGHVGRAVQDRQVQVDLGVRARGPPAGLLEPGERTGQVGGVEAAGRRRRHRRPGQHLTRHLEQQRLVARIAQDLGGRPVAETGDRQHRVLGHAGLQDAADALG